MRRKEGKTGIRMMRQEKEAGRKECALRLLVILLYFYMGIFGGIFGCLGVFPVPCDRERIMAAVAALGIFFCAVCLLGKYGKILLIGMLALYGWWIYRNWEILLEGGAIIGEVCLETMSHLQGDEWVKQYLAFEKECSLAFLTVLVPWAGILFSGFVLRGARFFTVLHMAVVIGGALAIGQVPSFASVCLMIGGLAGAFSTDGLEWMGGQKAGALLLTCMMVFLMMAGDAYVVPILQPLFEGKDELRARIQESSLIQEMSRQFQVQDRSWAAVGIGNGELGQVDYIKDSDRTMLRVAMPQKPQETIYLRCYTGADYTGKRWGALEETQSDRMMQEYFSVFSQIAISEGIFLDNLQIEPQEEAGDFAYQPYFSRLVGTLPVKSYTYFPRNQIEQLVKLGYRAPEVAYEYSDFIYRSYTSYPEERLTSLRKVCDSYEPESLEDLEDFIVSYLKGHASYNLHVGSFPEEKDFVEYFLFEANEGYCVHFASAATLMFRMYGIPARYVTGYAVPVSDFRKEGKNYQAWVKEGRAHAWTEIYVDGAGWMPVEATPGASLGSEDEQLPQRMTETKKETESTAMTEKQQEQRPEKEEDKQTMPSWAWEAAGFVGLLLLTAFARRRLLLRKRRRAGARANFIYLCGVLRLGGYRKQPDCESEEWVWEAEAHFSWIEKDALARAQELAMREYYGKKQATREESAFAARLYEEVCGNVYEGLTRIGKIKFRWWYVYGSLRHSERRS